MWCKHCGQDVPGVAQEQGNFGCSRCGTLTKPEAAHVVGLAQSADFGLDLSRTAGSATTTASDLDDWQLAEDLKQLRRTLHATNDGLPLSSGHVVRGLRADEPSQGGNVARAGFSTSPARRRGFVAWMITWLGLATCMCGVALLGLSLAEQRPELWNLGLPIALAGQFARCVD